MKQHYKSAGTLLVTGFLWSAQVWAIPAYPGLMKVTEPDGSTLFITKHGSEHAHYILSAEGQMLIERDGIHYYAEYDGNGRISATDIRASQELDEALKKRVSEIDQRELVDVALKNSSVNSDYVGSRHVEPRDESEFESSFGVGLFSYSTFPNFGDQRGLVILVEYRDVKFATPDPRDYFSRMLNEEGFSDHGATGSARDWFIHQSSGQFKPQFDVYGPVTLSHSMSWYGGNKSGGNDKAAYAMALEGCQALDDVIDFKDYDRDGDGVVDNIFVIYAGFGENSYGSAESVWPHSYTIPAATGEDYFLDGVKLDRYTCANELMKYSHGGEEVTRPDGIGTFVHEFSHVMGLPDLYTTNGSSAFTPGTWSVLDRGPYNNESRTPPNYSIFERNALGWLKPKVLSVAESVTLETIDRNVGCVVETSSPTEFYLFENRQQQGWDAYIPYHGMLVWHVDYKPALWDANVVNNLRSHQYVNLVEADNVADRYTITGDPFPGTNRVIRFADDTSPSMRTWGGESLNKPITKIKETDDGLITFDVCGGAAGVGSVKDDPENHLVIYTLHGMRILETTDGAESLQRRLKPGIYVAVNGSERSKVIVK